MFEVWKIILSDICCRIAYEKKTIDSKISCKSLGLEKLTFHLPRQCSAKSRRFSQKFAAQEMNIFSFPAFCCKIVATKLLQNPAPQKLTRTSSI